jgi:peptide/nickel transport system permease protein
MGLGRLVVRRLLLMIPLLLGVTLLTFILTHAVPFDPMVLVLSDRAQDTPDIVKATREKWGLDKSLPEQYVRYLSRTLQGDLGVSFKTRRPVALDLKEFLPATVELSLGALLFALVFGLPLGIIAAVKSGKWIDHVARIVSLLGASIPPFWSGLIALYLLYYRAGILPGPGRVSVSLTAPHTVTGLYLVDSLIAGNTPLFVDSLRHLILPCVILGWFTLALICRVTRASLLEVLGMDYVRTARSKGLQERIVVGVHALRNSMIPTVTVLGLAFAQMMAGAIMTETVFNWPGIGRYAVDSAASLDYPAVIGITLVIAVVYLFTNLLVDILYGVLDPRIRTD